MVQIIRPGLMCLMLAGLTCAALAHQPKCESMDIHYLCTHGVAQHAKVNVLSLRGLQEIEVKDAGRFDVTIFCTDADRLNMSISNQYIGTIALTYSTLIGQKGLGFAMFPLETDDRKGISGPTPGSFAVLNKCELLKNHVDGVLFNGSQIVPQRFLGAVDTAFLHFDLDRDENYVPTVPPRDQGEVDPWDFSGFYEFDAPDFYCLKVNEFMPKDFDYIPIMNTKGLPKRGRKDPRRICPRLKGYLVVDAHGGYAHHQSGRWS
jgi:hypothetical protein